jgi:peptidase A4-like protein
MESTRVRTHPLPSARFDPRSASPTELRRYGLPQRPDPSIRPELAALWDEILSHELTYLTPTFQPVEELLPGVAPHGPLRPDLATVTNAHWSGCVVHAPAGQTFTWVFGQWNVPDVEPPAPGEGKWYSFAWIGIDGISDVTQIGTIQYVSRDGDGNISKQCYAVHEWWSSAPNSGDTSWVTINNLPVNFGDTMIGLICMESTTDAWASLTNVTTGHHVSFDFSAPPNTTSQENQIEWIMECPQVNDVPQVLPNFGEIYFDSAMGGRGLELLADAGTDTVINMEDQDTHVTVATTTVETPTLLKIAYTGG